MKKFESGNLSEVKIDQKVRLLDGKLADYSKVWTVREKSENGLRLETVTEYGFETEFFFMIEAEEMEVEIA